MPRGRPIGKTALARVRDGAGPSLGNLATPQDILNARRTIFRETAAKRMSESLARVLFTGLDGMRDDMRVMMHAALEERVRAFEQQVLTYNDPQVIEAAVIEAKDSVIQ